MVLPRRRNGNRRQQLCEQIPLWLDRVSVRRTNAPTPPMYICDEPAVSLSKSGEEWSASHTAEALLATVWDVAESNGLDWIVLTLLHTCM